jgi:hypothetical protein
MFLPRWEPCQKTAALRPYFFVLNNILRHTLDPKIGDTTVFQNDAPRLLLRFAPNAERFSVSDFMWRRICTAALEPKKAFPYAPYLQYIIEQVVGRRFHRDWKHRTWRVVHLGPHKTKKKGVPSSPTANVDEEEEQDIEAAYDKTDDDDEAEYVPPRPVRTRSSSRRTSFSQGDRGDDGAIKYALKKLFSCFCAKAKRDEETFAQIRASLELPEPTHPLPDFRDPFEEYEEMVAATRATARAYEAGAPRAPGAESGVPAPGDDAAAGPSWDPKGKRKVQPASPPPNNDDDDDDDDDGGNGGGDLGGGDFGGGDYGGGDDADYSAFDWYHMA